MLDFLYDLFFPKRCVSCGSLGFYICQNCRKEVKFFSSQICPVCHKPSVDGVSHLNCRTKHTLDGLLSAAYFSGPLRLAIHKLKYKLISDLADELVDLLLSNPSLVLILQNMVSKGYVLTPVPLHPKREKWRGFNQAEVLAKKISEKTKMTFSSGILKREKNTVPQVDLKKEERQKNVANAFEVLSQKEVLGKKFLLFDDTTTTGSTLRACAYVLKKKGAREVWALTLARSAR